MPDQEVSTSLDDICITSAVNLANLSGQLTS